MKGAYTARFPVLFYSGLAAKYLTDKRCANGTPRVVPPADQNTNQPAAAVTTSAVLIN
jgi:hypothetical protein